MILSSFDIFDTTLIRKCGRPENVYKLLAAELFPDDIQMQFRFVCWRCYNHHSYAYNPNYTLNDVYEEWNSEIWKGLTKECVMSREYMIESSLLTSNDEIIRIINKHRKTSDKIIFISDMYLDSAFLRNILIREGAFQEGDDLYVSCECMARKDHGDLYDYIRNIYNPQLWIHYGDNRHSDYIVPKSKGIKAVWVPEAYYPSETSIIEHSSYAPYWHLSTLAGISRAARRKFGNTAEAVLAADFVAPSLIPYVDYILSDARRKGIKTLYFLARDGYILMKIAELLQHDDIQLKFLFVSRKALLPAFLYDACEVTFVNLFQSHSLKGKTVSEVMSLIEQRDCVMDFNFDTIQTKEQERKVLEVIFEPSFHRIWQENFKSRSELLFQYFQQEGVLNDDIALVDVGWYGSTRMIVNTIRNNAGKRNCHNYYWGTQPGVIGTDYGDYNCFSLRINRDSWVTFLFEDYFLTCPYPSTEGYKYENQKIVPVFVDDKEYRDNPYFNVNFGVVQYMIHAMSNYSFEPNVLHAWSMMTLHYIVSNSNKIDFSPLMKICNHDTFVFRKITKGEIIKYIRGWDITINDVASLNSTYGNCISNIFMKSRMLYKFLRTGNR